MVSSPTRQVSAQHNNKGVDLMENGQYCEAISSFKDALQNLMRAQQQPQSRGPFKDEADHTQRHPSKCRLDSAFQAGEEKSYLYCHAFRIQQDASHVGDSTSCYVQDTAVILFNLSLVNHLRHLTTKGNSDPLNMLKALKFYEMVQALVTAPENVGLINDPNLLLILMACCNNMGHIHHSLGLFSDTMLDMQLLSSTLAVWHSRSNNPYSATVPVEADDMHGFTMNLLLLREPAHAPAA